MDTISNSTLRTIRLIAWRFRRTFLILFVAILFQSAITGIYALSIAPIADFVLSGEKDPSQITKLFIDAFEYFDLSFSLLSAIVTTSLIVVFSGISSIITKYVSARLKFRVLEELLSELLQDLLGARYQFLLSSRTGTILNSFQKEVEKIGDILGHSISGLVALIQVLVLVSVPLAINPDLTVALFIAGVLATSPLWLLKRISNKLGSKSVSTANEVASVLYDVLSSLKLIIVFGKQSLMSDRYRSAFATHAKFSIWFVTLLSAVSSIVVPLGTVAVLTVFYQAQTEAVDIAEIAITLFAFIKVLPFIQEVLKVKVTIEGFVPAFQQVYNLRSRAIAAYEKKAGKPFDRLCSVVALDKVSFAHVPGVSILKDLSLEIHKGSMVGLAGASGSGKSTVCDLMLGLYKPDAGEILIDGTALDQICLNDWREKVGYVPQESQLFNISIRENLVWGHPQTPSESEIITACQRAHALDFISQLPSGLDTVVGERGDRLSGGQRQRIAIARALCRSPEFLLLDESTSGLDFHSEQAIWDVLQSLRGTTTILVITHKEERLKDVDYIYNLSEGSLAS